MLKTRQATTADAALIAELSRATFIETFGDSNTSENMTKFLEGVFNVESLKKEVGSEGNIFILIEENGAVIGYARLINKETQGLADAIEIARIYVLKKFIGKGAGKRLMQSCVDIATSEGKRTIWLGVWEKNIRAITFYQQWGFEKFGTHVFMLGDDAQTDWLMKKNLAKTSLKPD